MVKVNKKTLYALNAMALYLGSSRTAGLHVCNVGNLLCILTVWMPVPVQSMIYVRSGNVYVALDNSNSNLGC